MLEHDKDLPTGPYSSSYLADYLAEKLMPVFAENIALAYVSGVIEGLQRASRLMNGKNRENLPLDTIATIYIKGAGWTL